MSTTNKKTTTGKTTGKSLSSVRDSQTGRVTKTTQTDKAARSTSVHGQALPPIGKHSAITAHNGRSVPSTGLSPDDLARLAAFEQFAARTRPTEPPLWLDDIQPENPPTDGTNGLHRIVGAWPGDESDEEVAAALEALS